MATELNSRSFRIEDEVWKAVQAHELSANQLLRRALGMPWKQSKKAQAIEKIKASDPVGAERPDVQYGSDELPSGGSVLNAIAPPAGSKTGKVSIETWRRPPRQKGDKSR